MQVTVLVLMTLLTVVLGGVLARATRWPAPLVQMALGAGLYSAGLSTAVLDPQVFFLLFLPPLLFLDGWRIPNDALRRDALVILRLALGLVVFTVLGMGLLIHWLIPGMPMSVAFALAAVLSPTDPTAVSSIAARSPLAPRMLHVLQGEALFNDASGLICLRVAVAATLTGSFTLTSALGDFAWMSVVGLGIGVAVTWALAKLTARVTHRWGEDGGGLILLTLLLPFGAYLLAEAVHGSGILAAAAAGVTMSASDVWRWSATLRLRLTAVWDLVQTAVNGSIFVLLGSQIPALWGSAPRTAAASGHAHPAWLLLYVVVITAGLATLRGAWVWTAMRWQARSIARQGGLAAEVGPRTVLVVTLAGVRGAVTLAAVMTWPLTLADGGGFPARDLAVLLAAGVIVLSMLLATLVLPRVLGGLQPPAPSGVAAVIQELRQAAARQAIAAIEAMPPEGTDATDGPPPGRGRSAAEVVIAEYRRRIDRSDRHDSVAGRHQDDRMERKARLVGLRAERSALRQLAAARGVDDLVLRRLVREIDHQEVRHLA